MRHVDATMRNNDNEKNRIIDKLIGATRWRRRRQRRYCCRRWASIWCWWFPSRSSTAFRSRRRSWIEMNRLEFARFGPLGFEIRSEETSPPMIIDDDDNDEDNDDWSAQQINSVRERLSPTERHFGKSSGLAGRDARRLSRIYFNLWTGANRQARHRIS